MRRQVRQGESAGSAIRRCEPKRLTRMRKVKRKPLQSTTPCVPRRSHRSRERLPAHRLIPYTKEGFRLRIDHVSLPREGETRRVRLRAAPKGDRAKQIVQRQAGALLLVR